MEISRRLTDERSPVNLALFAGLAVLAGAAAAMLSDADPRTAGALTLAVPFAYVLWRSWRSPLLGLYLLVATAALDIAGRITPKGAPPLTVYQVVLVVVTAAVAREMWQRRQAREARTAPSLATPLDLPMLAYLAVVALSVGLAPRLSTAVIDLITVASSVLVYYLVVYLVQDVRQARNLVITLLATAAGLAAFGLLERFTGYSILGRLTNTWAAGVRVRGTFNDPNIFAAYLMTAGAFAAPVVLESRRRLLRWGGLALIVLIGGSLFVTFSRGAWLGSAVAALIILVLSRLDARAKIAILLIVALAVPLAFAALPQRFLESKLTNLGQDPSAQARVLMAESAWRIVQDHPWGVGIGAYPDVFPAYRFGSVRAGLIESHTAYLTLLVEIGFFGLILFLWMLCAFAVRAVSALPSIEDPAAHAVLLGAFAAFAAVSTEAFFYSLESFKLWWLAMGVGMAIVQIHKTARGGSHVD
jgi:putative inorganic carbon (HCO3(-)) transporter